MGGLFSTHVHTLSTGSLFGTILDFALSFFTLLIKNSLKILASFAGFVINSGGSPSFSVWIIAVGARFFTVPNNSFAVLQALEESSLSLNLFSKYSVLSLTISFLITSPKRFA